MKTVLVVDDHPVVALGIKLALQTNQRFCLAGVVTDPMDPKGAIAAHAPDALVLDLAFAGAVNLQLIRACRTLLPRAIIVVFSSLPSRLYRQDSLGAGADAYLTKDHDIDELIALITTLFSKAPKLAGADQKVRTSTHEGQSALGDGARLTPKESEIGRLLSHGLSVAEIAAFVGANHNTISVHRENMRRKLGCRTSSELIARLARLYLPMDLNND